MSLATVTIVETRRFVSCAAAGDLEDRRLIALVLVAVAGQNVNVACEAMRNLARLGQTHPLG